MCGGLTARNAVSFQTALSSICLLFMLMNMGVVSIDSRKFSSRSTCGKRRKQRTHVCP